MATNCYPSLEVIKPILSDPCLLEQIGFKNFSELEAMYKNGCFVLPSFVNFRGKDFCNKDFGQEEFAINVDNGKLATGGCALLSHKSIKGKRQGRSSKRSKYSKTLFQTGHILGYQLVYNIKNFHKIIV